VTRASRGLTISPEERAVKKKKRAARVANEDVAQGIESTANSI
jgi:hypothetical protein